MRELANEEHTEQFMRALGRAAKVEPELYRFPAIDPTSFRRSVDDLFG